MHFRSTEPAVSVPLRRLEFQAAAIRHLHQVDHVDAVYGPVRSADLCEEQKLTDEWKGMHNFMLLPIENSFVLQAKYAKLTTATDDDSGDEEADEKVTHLATDLRPILRHYSALAGSSLFTTTAYHYFGS